MVSPLRVIQVGAGDMGGVWLRTLRDAADVELVGLADLNTEAARAAAVANGHPDAVIGASISEIADAAAADAVINVTVPAAHHAVSTEAMRLGLPVLSEKPAAPTVALALSLAATSDVTGTLLMVSQSRRYYRTLEAFSRSIRELGGAGILAHEFFKAPRFGGFRDAMAYPLLVDMAIHPFDAARMLLGAEPVSVYSESFNPSWSWYAGDAATLATFAFADGTRFQYTGSWCSDGFETSWNGSWRASCRTGTATWDGDAAPRVAAVDAAGAAASLPGDAAGDAGADLDRGPEDIAGALAEFVSVVRTGASPEGRIHRNIGSLAMVEAAMLSTETGSRVLIADVLADALGRAIADEPADDVRERLAGFDLSGGLPA